MMLGCERVFHINDRFGDDVLLAQQLGLVRIFDQSTVNRFLRTFTKWNTNQLERILMVTIQVHGQFVGLVCRILDKDSDHKCQLKPERQPSKDATLWHK